LEAQGLLTAPIAIDAGSVCALAEETTPKTAADLAKKTGAEELLIGEIYLSTNFAKKPRIEPYILIKVSYAG